ncbi:hypothetical protein [Nocardia stercoris]|nr:hypothetical protein [Nocardia stercoris]
MSKRYPPEVREKAVRLALERLDEYGSAYAAARAIGPMVDVHHETLRLWIKKALDDAPSPNTAAAPHSTARNSTVGPSFGLWWHSCSTATASSTWPSCLSGFCGSRAAWRRFRR